jgi:hypothetical protein
MANSKSADMPIDNPDKPLRAADIGQKLKMGAGLFFSRRNTHQPDNRQIKRATIGDKRIAIGV